MKLAVIPMVVMLVGSSLIVSSFILTSSRFGPDPPWSEQQARELARASSVYHQLGHRHDHSDTDLAHDSIELAQAKQRYDRLNAELQSAVSRNRFTSQVMKWTGILLAAVGAIGVCLVASRNGS